MAAVQVSREAAPGMDELTPVARRALRCRTPGGCEAAFVPTQRWTQRHTHAAPEHVLSCRRAAAEVGSVAAAAGFPPEVAGVIDISNTLEPGDEPGQRLVWALPLSARNGDNGSLPPEPPDLQCAHAFALAVQSITAGRDIATVAVHCNHGCNRTGVLLVHYLWSVSPDRSLRRLEELIREFAEARHALPSAWQGVGLYEADALWQLYKLCGFLPPVRPLPATLAALRAQTAPPLPPRRQPRVRPCSAAGFAVSSASATVPMSYLSLPDGATR